MPVVLLVLTMLVLSACGENNPPGPASQPRETGSAGAADDVLRPLGAPIDVGGLRVRVDVKQVGSDKDGPWVLVRMRVKNVGKRRVALPFLELVCAEPTTHGYMNADVASIAPGRSVSSDVHLLISDTGRTEEEYFAPIPPCGATASISVMVTSGQPDYTESESAGWQVDAGSLEKLNATLPFTRPGGDPKDPDRPYAWVEDDVYSSGYTVIFVRGLSVPQVLRALGGIQRDAGALDHEGVWDVYDEGMDPETYAAPTVVTAAEHDGGVVVFAPFGHYVGPRQMRALSRGGVAATYGNTVNGDDHIVVAREGKVLRNFDPFLDDSYDKNGPLPEEKGLDLEYDTGPASWTLLERLTSIHVTREWLEGPQPTYVLKN